MIVKFMDGPKAGEVANVGGQWRKIRVLEHPGESRYTRPGRNVYREVTYEVYEYQRHVFENEHVSVSDWAKLAYSGQRDDHPSGDLPWQRESHEFPIPNFLTDFDAWWRRLLWDQQVVQDRETRWELQKLEYAKGRYE